MAIPKTSLDHCPILLQHEVRDFGPSPFKFEVMWLEVEGFKEQVVNWWESMAFEGSANYVGSEIEGVERPHKEVEQGIFWEIRGQNGCLP